MTAPPPLVCIGNITIDDAVLPDGTVRADCLGGDAVYAGLAARLFTPLAEVLAPVGNDLPPDARRAMQRAGISIAGLPARDVPTIRNTVTYTAAGDRTWDLVGGQDSFDALSVHPGDLTARHLAAPGFIVAAMSLGAQLATTEHLRAATDATIYLDLQEDYITGRVDDVMRMVAASDVFLPSAEEVRRLLGTEDWHAACVELAGHGPSVVVVKLAEQGSVVHDRATGTTTEVPALLVDAVDSTGAGDAYVGGFAAVHLATGDALAAARAGGVTAGFAVSDFGNAGLLRATAEQARERLTRWSVDA